MSLNEHSNAQKNVSSLGPYRGFQKYSSLLCDVWLQVLQLKENKKNSDISWHFEQHSQETAPTLCNIPKMLKIVI